MSLLPRFDHVLLLLVACLATAWVSCKQTTGSEDPPSAKSTEIFPLAVGNWWISKTDTFDSTGTLIRTLIDTATVVGDSTIAAEQWFYFASGSHSFYRNRTDGQYSFVQEWSPEPFLNLKYPAQAGQSYAIPYGLRTMAIVKTDTVVSTSLGRYRCYQYRTAFTGNWVEDYFYCAGVGMVASTGVQRSSSGSIIQTYRQTLMTYTTR